jgi:uncharacterized protein YndB with AHSA1/START domain
MSRQSFSVHARSSGPPDAVFDVLADSARWSEWAGPLIRRSSWEREGSPDVGGVGAIRRLGSSRIFSREEIVEYDRPNHLAYTILSGQPVRQYRADVSLTPSGGGTDIRWEATFLPRLPGTGRFVRWYLSKIVGGLATNLARRSAAS